MRDRTVLFIAMSGVRVRSRELLELGMTLPGFVERGRVIASLPSLGLLTLAGCTPSHWHCEYREIDEMEDVDSDADLVAISSLTARIEEAYALADRLRAAGRTVVLGGLHVSALPDEAAEHADAVVRGEGESVWPQLLRDFEDGCLRAEYGPVPHCLDRGGLPRFDLLDVSRYNRVTIQTSRGCPLDCAFCASSRTISAYKRKPIPRVRDELERILEIWPQPFIELADDNTFAHKAYGRELADLLGSYRVRWFTETDISVADDEALLERLARAGCAQLLIGFESARRDALVGLDRAQFKARRHEAYAAKIQAIQSHGISVNGCFVLGFDTDGPEAFEQTRDFVRASGLSEVQITLLTPFPGTALHRRLASDGRLLRERNWADCTLFDVTFRPLRMTTSELEAGFHGLMRDLYSPTATAHRRDTFRECLRGRLRKERDTCAMRY